jgi:hypothetical protein
MRRNIMPKQKIITAEKAKDLFPYTDWQYDVANGDTKLGYDDWVLHNLESNNYCIKE